MAPESPLPQHRTSRWIVTGEAACVMAAAALILIHVGRLMASSRWHDGWLILVVLAAWPAADFVSGLVHWLADTWGSERWPIVGQRFIRPFRVHHVNPQGMLQSGFFDTIGDSAFITIPILLMSLMIPLDSLFGRALSVFLVAFCFWGLPTNQIHYWAHMDQPPRWVAWLQRHRLILSPQHHAAHHRSPHHVHYCITTGWCNAMLDQSGFFRRIEWLIECLIGAKPRAEDELLGKDLHGGGQHLDGYASRDPDITVERDRPGLARGNGKPTCSSPFDKGEPGVTTVIDALE